MSSASSSLAAPLAALLILLATMAEGDVSEQPTSSSRSSSSSSFAPSTTASVAEAVAGQRASRRNRTDEMVLVAVSSTVDPRYVPTTRTTTERDDIDGSTHRLRLGTATVPIANATPTTVAVTPTTESTKNYSVVQNKPQQEQLIGLKENVTDRLADISTTPSNVPRERTSTTRTATEFSRPSTIASTSTTSTTTTTTTKATTTTRSSATTHLEAGKSSSSKTRNDLLGGNFHEIKPAQKVNTNKLYFGGKIVKPNVPSALGKYTPYFEDGQEELNVTARIGSTVILDCEIGMLGNKTVTWSHHSTDVIRLLTFGRNAYSVDQRISLSFKYPTNWRLRIQYATPRDSGLYECQVATYPPLVKKIHLLVTAPILVIMDDSGRIKSGERHLKAGSALRLRCEARDVPEQYNETVVWTRGDEILSEDVSENRTTDVLDGREVQVIISTFVIERATPRHAGNYSCVVPEKARATVAVHVLNGELPAAVHDGNGVSRSVFNLWLIHLTISYVFSR